MAHLAYFPLFLLAKNRDSSFVNIFALKNLPFSSSSLYRDTVETERRNFIY